MLKMFRRFFWLVLGFVLGLSSSWAFSRRVRRVAQRYVPAEVADRWSGTMRAAVMVEPETTLRSSRFPLTRTLTWVPPTSITRIWGLDFVIPAKRPPPAPRSDTAPD